MRKLLTSPDYLGNRVMQARRFRGLTRKELASKIFVSAQTMYQMEVGLTTISFENAIQISRALDISLDVIASDNPITDPLTEDMKSLPEWAEILGTSRQRLSYWCRNGRLHYTRVGGAYYTDIANLSRISSLRKRLQELELI